MFPEGRILDFLIVGVIALIVVGPKDLPVLMRNVGKFVAHMRGMAAEFRASFDEMARQSELDELRREVEAMRAGHSLQTAALGDDSTAHQVFDEIDTHMRGGEVQLPAPVPFDPPPNLEKLAEATARPEPHPEPPDLATAAPKAPP